MAEQRGKLNFLERAGAALSPKWGLDRSIAKAQLQQFAATRPGRARGRMATAWQQGSSESWKKGRERIDAIWEARAMEENFCIIAGLLQRISMYVCGTLEYQPQTGDEAIDKEYADYFHDWCGRSDITGRHRFREQVALALTGAIRDGEHGFIRHMEGGELRLQSIEGDRIGNPNSPKQDEENINGIVIDKRGRVKHYEIYRRTRTVKYELDGTVKPSRFMHLLFPSRPDQYHGVSKLAPALPHARDLYELLGHEKIAAKFAASFTGFVRMKDPGAPGASDFEEPTQAGQPATYKAEPGSVMRFQNGEEDIQFAPGSQRPTNAFIQLVEALIREIALSLVLPYGFVYNMAAFGGVTARLETKAAQRTIRYYQERLQDVILNRVVEEVLMLGIARKEIPWADNWKKGAWRFGAEITGDVGHQTTADLALVDAGGKTITQLAAEHGNSFPQVVDQKAAELETILRVAKGKKIPVELLAGWLNNPTQMIANMERAAKGEPGPDDPPPPPPGQIGTLGDKGAKQILEVLAMVGKGETDRESAILTLVNVYGMPVGEAEAIVPKPPEDPNGVTA